MNRSQQPRLSTIMVGMLTKHQRECPAPISLPKLRCLAEPLDEAEATLQVAVINRQVNPAVRRGPRAKWAT